MKQTVWINGRKDESGSRRMRLEAMAEHILEGILKRRRWTASDRDAIADYLDRAVIQEMKERMK